jgi:hypothetical protein
LILPYMISPIHIFSSQPRQKDEVASPIFFLARP